MSTNNVLTKTDLKNILEQTIPTVDHVKEQLPDYVVDRGTSGIWKYRKWNSGDVELWGETTLTLTNYASSIGGSWYGYNTGSISLPFTVYSPNTQISAKVGTGFAHSGNCYTAGGQSSITAITGYAIANTSGSQTTQWHFQIQGKWKT